MKILHNVLTGQELNHSQTANAVNIPTCGSNAPFSYPHGQFDIRCFGLAVVPFKRLQISPFKTTCDSQHDKKTCVSFVLNAATVKPLENIAFFSLINWCSLSSFTIYVTQPSLSPEQMNTNQRKILGVTILQRIQTQT